MGSVLLNAVWVGSFKATRLETEQIHATILVAAEEAGIGELVSNVSSSSNGLTQFLLAPCGSKEGFPDNRAWEALVVLLAERTTGTSFIIKRFYVAET